MYVCTLEEFITARKRSLGQGNVLSSVCQGFCPQEGDMRDRGRAWRGEGVCMVEGGGGMCGRGHVWWGGVHGRGACMTDTTRYGQ